MIADGPRPDKVGDAENATTTRAIIDRVDWDCDVLKNYSPVNLGVGIRPATGLRWVFEQVESAIILGRLPPHQHSFHCDELSKMLGR